MADPDALRRSLGLKPRRSSPSSERASKQQEPETAPAAEEKSEPITDPLKKPVGKLPQEAQVLLRRFYMMRPEVDLPPHVHALSGTWGRYFGDGREAREVKIGFRPAFVLFLLPVYPGEAPKWVAKKGNKAEGEMVDPGLHDQPPLTEQGFVAPASCNQINEQTIYIAWKHDGSVPVAEPEPEEENKKDESPRDARRRAQLEKRQRDLEERRARAAGRRR